MARFCDEATTYAHYVEAARLSRELVATSRLIREEAARTRALVALDREKRARQAEARDRLRSVVTEYVTELKRAGGSLDSVLRTTGQLMYSLRRSGSVTDDEGAFEVEIQRIVAEEYVSAA